MLITGKNKEQFEKWLRVNKFEDLELFERIFEDFFFMELPFEMQLGIYLAYYDSLGYDICVDCESTNCYTSGIFNTKLEPRNESYYIPVVMTSKEPLVNTRNEAYKEAFKKADELINQQLN